MRYIAFSCLILLGSCKGSDTEVTAPESTSIEDTSADIDPTPVMDTNEITEVDTAEIITPSVEKKSFSYSVISTVNGWGYQIFEEGQMIINQEHIPAIPGVQSFDSEEKASRTAAYLVTQLENGHFPPTISPAILDSLDVL